MKKYFLILLLGTWGSISHAQKMTIVQMKSELEKSPNPPLYTKDILKKKFKLDTIVVTRTSVFHGLADSLAYNGKMKKTYGPHIRDGKKFLVLILAKSPNIFYRV
ncbi:MAG TPA: hypothetical protein VKR53_01200, partial [Puia sp.]|nr:hypothetical protein [Puia sp.]